MFLRSQRSKKITSRQSVDVVTCLFRIGSPRYKSALCDSILENNLVAIWFVLTSLSTYGHVQRGLWRQGGLGSTRSSRLALRTPLVIFLLPCFPEFLGLSSGNLPRSCFIAFQRTHPRLDEHCCGVLHGLGCPLLCAHERLYFLSMGICKPNHFGKSE